MRHYDFFRPLVFFFAGFSSSTNFFGLGASPLSFKTLQGIQKHGC
jgi:hypothetical protein